MTNIMKYNSLQEVFDVVAEHLLKQGVQATIEICDESRNQDYVGCAYRSECGTLKCDRCANSRRKIQKVRRHKCKYILKGLDSWGRETRPNAQFANKLTKVHDRVKMGFENWNQALIYVAKKHKLNTNR